MFGTLWTLLEVWSSLQFCMGSSEPLKTGGGSIQDFYALVKELATFHERVQAEGKGWRQPPEALLTKQGTNLTTPGAFVEPRPALLTRAVRSGSRL